MRFILNSWIFCFFGTAFGEPVLKNSGFEGKLEPWACEEGKIVRDPAGGPNQVLEVALENGVFALDQKLEWPAGAGMLELRLRVRSSDASEDSPVQLRARLVDGEGNSAIVAAFRVVKANEWLELKSLVRKPNHRETVLLIESNRGDGLLWLDDIKLMEIRRQKLTP